MSPKTLVCRQADPNLSAWRTPDHFGAGCGAFQRRSATGGAAKGTPLNMRTEWSALVVPSRIPVSIFTWSFAAWEFAGIAFEKSNRPSADKIHSGRDIASPRVGR